MESGYLVFVIGLRSLFCFTLIACNLNVRPHTAARGCKQSSSKRRALSSKRVLRYRALTESLMWRAPDNPETADNTRITAEEEAALVSNGEKNACKRHTHHPPPVAVGTNRDDCKPPCKIHTTASNPCIRFRVQPEGCGAP